MSIEVSRLAGESLGELRVAEPISLDRVIEIPELSISIFSYLTFPDLQNAACVSRSMRASVITAANFNEPVLVRKCIQQAIEAIELISPEVFPQQIDILRTILQDCTVHEFGCLLLLKNHMSFFREQLIAVLKTIQPNLNATIALAEDPWTRVFFDYIFDLFAFRSEIDKANSIPDITENVRALGVPAGSERGWALGVIFGKLWDRSLDLARAGNLIKAVVVVVMIPNDVRIHRFGEPRFAREGALADIAALLAGNGDINGALQVIRMVPDGGSKDRALMEICAAIRDDGDTTGARIAVSGIAASMIADNEMRARAFAEINRIHT
ncbi:MAG TPA: F-box protein, partial [Chlamydiales bacterium]|nr:F-box protein [Chlamydiales bacterium]